MTPSPSRDDPAVRHAEQWLAERHPELGGRQLAFAAQLAAVASKMIHDGADLGQLKLVASAVKEMRHAYRVFNRFRGVRKVSIFGSARTPRRTPTTPPRGSSVSASPPRDGWRSPAPEAAS